MTTGSETRSEAAHQFNLALFRARLTQVRAAELFDVDARSVRRWASGTTPVPVAVTVLLRLLHHKRITVDDIEYFAGRISSEELVARKDVAAAKSRLAKIQRAKIEAEIQANEAAAREELLLLERN
jgi:hypothetical protein